MQNNKHYLKTFVIGLLLTMLFLFTSYEQLSTVLAENSTTTVTVENDSPTFSVAPFEDPASDNTTPTNVGSAVTFRATGSDVNGDGYYLAICKTNAITANDGSAPTCTGGNWCVSSSTANGVQANCNYTVTTSEVNETYAWYAFVCDAVPAGASCSSADQGTGSSGSPYSVNHAPSFSAIVDDGGSGADSGDDPGGTIQFTATASDSDSAGTPDTVLLVVCADSNGATASGCSGTQLCSSALTATNPSCTYNLPAVRLDGNVNYWSYVFDSHNFASASNPRTGQYTVNNVAPVVSNVVINSASNITLTENTTTNVPVTATVTDNNSCQDLSSVTTGLYRSAVTFSNCDNNGEDDDNDCYAVVTCSVSGGSCTSSSDAAANYSCTVAMQYHSDPTDTDTQFTSDNWLATVLATDGSAAQGSLQSASGVEVLSLVALDVTSSINYGALSKGADTGATNQTTVVTATGNTGLDTEIGGTDMCTDYPTCAGGVITVDNQEYALSGFTFGAGSDLSTVATEVEINIAKTTSSVAPETGNVLWGIAIPGTAQAGTYTGQNTVTAVKGEVVEW